MLKVILILCYNKYVFKYILKYILKYIFKIMRRRLENKSIRKVYKTGSSYALTLPIEIVRELKIRDGQKLVVKKQGKSIIIKDWKK
jgi:hypothetical protein